MPRRFAPIKPLKDVRQVFIRNALPGVMHLDRHPGVIITLFDAGIEANDPADRRSNRAAEVLGTVY
jgi:hypothetical protein